MCYLPSLAMFCTGKPVHKVCNSWQDDRMLIDGLYLFSTNTLSEIMAIE